MMKRLLISCATALIFGGIWYGFNSSTKPSSFSGSVVNIATTETNDVVYDKPLEPSNPLQNSGPQSSAMPLQFAGPIVGLNILTSPMFPMLLNAPIAAVTNNPVFVTTYKPSIQQFASEIVMDIITDQIYNLVQQNYATPPVQSTNPPVVYNPSAQTSMSPN
jgi:hypothetical protein